MDTPTPTDALSPSVPASTLPAAKLTATNPVTKEILGEVVITDPSQAPEVMRRAREAQAQWASLSLSARMQVIQRARDLFFERREALNDLIIKELGKVPFEARFELLQPLAWFNFVLKHAPKLLKDRKVFIWQLFYRRNYVMYKPHGVVLLIAPWNFPVVLATDTLVPALAAGNAVVYKPSEYTPLIAEFIVKLFHDAGLPKNVLQIAHGYGDTGAALIAARPDKISFTGSVPTGRKIASQAAELLIPVTLELGGKDAAIVLEDADIAYTAKGVVWSSMVHGGQLCASVELVYVMRPIADKLIGAMREVVKKSVKAGRPDDKDATYGTLTLPRQLEVVQGHIEESVERGARVYREQPLVFDMANHGGYHDPVIITDVPLDANVVTQETFGPVMVVIPIDSAQEAIQYVNNSEYGLSASVWSRDTKRAEEIARQLNVGMVSINDHVIAMSAPNLPWGGRRNSGYGRNRSLEGISGMAVPMSLSNARFRPPIEIFWYPYSKAKETLLKKLAYLWFGPTWRDKISGLWRT